MCFKGGVFCISSFFFFSSFLYSVSFFFFFFGHGDLGREGFEVVSYINCLFLSIIRVQVSQPRELRAELEKRLKSIG